MKPARIVVTIDTLTLEGFGARERRVIADALTQALTQRFADVGANGADAARGYCSVSLDTWRALDVQRGAHSTPASLGAMLAERVWRGVMGTQPRAQRQAQGHPLMQPQAEPLMQPPPQPRPQPQRPALAPLRTPAVPPASPVPPASSVPPASPATARRR